MCNQSFVPMPAYKVGDRVQTRWVTDDRELCVETGTIFAMTFTNDKRHPTLDAGWNYHLFKDSDDNHTPRFSDPDNAVHESEIFQVIGELQASE